MSLAAKSQNHWIFTPKERIVYREYALIKSMLCFRRHRDKSMVHARRVLRGRFVAFVLAVALVVPVPVTPAEAIPREDTGGISVSIAASEQGAAGLSDRALVCHMHFEHHQLVRAESALVMPAPDAVRACYSTGVSWLASLKPAPLRRPPRA